MLDRRKYGLQLQCIDQDTYLMKWYTPRNLDVAFAMAEVTAATDPRRWLFKILRFRGTQADDPIIFDTELLEEFRQIHLRP